MSAKRIKIKKKLEKPSIVEQWVEVEVLNGVTTSTRYPGDEELLSIITEKTEQTGRAVDLVYRRFNFVHGVPREYYWSTQDPLQRQYGGHFLQRLRLEDWLAQIGLEAGGHLMYSPVVMPRPESSGRCECPSCRAAERRIAILGK